MVRLARVLFAPAHREGEVKSELSYRFVGLQNCCLLAAQSERAQIIIIGYSFAGNSILEHSSMVDGRSLIVESALVQQQANLNGRP